MEEKTEEANHAKAVKSGQEYVVGNDKARSLNTLNRDVRSNNINNTVDTREMILRVNFLWICVI